MYLYDYHMHSLISCDGKSSVSELCAKAIASGLQEIAVTDHFEPSQGNEKYPCYNADSYFNELMKADFNYGKKLRIKRAIELGQPHMYPEYSLKLVESYPYDYVLASVHKMRDNKDFGVINYSKENVYYYCINYLDEIRSLAQWDKFDCIGHLDLIKRYASRYGIKVNFMDYKERLEEIFKIIIRNNKGIEVNTSGLRQSARECMPGLDIIRFYRELGGEIITVGSDAHTSADVGKGIAEAIEIIKLAGFDYMTVFKDRQADMIKISEKSSHYHFSKQPA